MVNDTVHCPRCCPSPTPPGKRNYLYGALFGLWVWWMTKPRVGN